MPRRVNFLNDQRKIVAVCAATGRQGSSVVDFLVADETFSVRGLTRNPDKAEARMLEERGVDVFKADYDDFDSLLEAFTGVFAVYAVTDWFTAGDHEREQGYAIVDACVKAGVQHVVWCAAEHHEFKIPYYETKADVADYLAKSGIGWTTILPTFYYSNLFLMGISKLADGSIRVAVPWPSDATIPMLDSADIGAFALIVFKNPEEWNGKEMPICSEYLTPQDIAKTYEEVADVPVSLVSMTIDEFYAFDKDAFPFGPWVWLNMKLFMIEGTSGKRSTKLARQLYPEMKTWRQYASEHVYEPPKCPLLVYMVTQEFIFYHEDNEHFQASQPKNTSTVKAEGLTEKEHSAIESLKRLSISH